MLLDTPIEQSTAISESVELIQSAPVSDILYSFRTPQPALSLFSENTARKAWHADNMELARCDLSEEHIHLFPKVGLRVIAVWKRSVKGPTLAEIKEDDAMVPIFANRIAHTIREVMGTWLRDGGFAVVTTPRRRHKERNFACLVAQAIAQRLGIPYHPDVAVARTKQRIGVDFEPGNIPPETNLIVFDDFVTTGSTLGAMNRLLAPMGKNLIYFTGVDNQ